MIKYRGFLFERIKKMKKTIRIFGFVLALCALMLCMVSCSGADREASETGKGTNIINSVVRERIDSMKVSDFKEVSGKSDYVLIKVKDYGEIVVVLRDDVAPITVKNFKKLVGDGFYDGMIFHRVIENFMIQGGGGTEIKDGKLTSKYADPIKGEFYVNGVPNNLQHMRGVISMARTSKYDSASSQFFIMHGDSNSLDGSYASFGYVLAGMDVVDAIATCKVDATDKDAPVPVENVVIESISFVKPK